MSRMTGSCTSQHGRGSIDAVHARKSCLRWHENQFASLRRDSRDGGDDDVDSVGCEGRIMMWLPSVLKRLVARVAVLTTVAFVVFGCATADHGKRIVPDEVGWIERDRTTRAEIVTRFGLPSVEFPRSSDFNATSQTATSTTDPEGHIKTIQMPAQVQPPTRSRKATYVYNRREPSVFPFYDNPRLRQCQFWIVYDEKDVVQDYGFEGNCDGQLQDRRLHLADAD